MKIQTANAKHGLGEPTLVELIREKIRRDGPVPFRWFMEQALYHPEYGYYSSGRATIGRRGDYFTNVSVGPLFGRIMAEQFRQMWEIMERPAAFTIVEQGAHDGEFARDVISTVRQTMTDFAGALRYAIVEPFRPLRARQTETLAQFEGVVSWCQSLDQLDPFSGVHFSNELFDALPVYLISHGSSAPDWQEKFVVEAEDGFGFADLPIRDAELHRAAAGVRVPSGTDYETEVNLAAPALVAAISRKLRHGFLLAVDYGYAREEFYSAMRNRGSMQCRIRHRVLRSPLVEIGRADITAHVEWTSLAMRGLASGLELAGFTDQHHFLTGMIAGPMRVQFQGRDELPEARALQMLLHPEFLGRSFLYLALSKGIDANARLSGFAFAKPAREQLGLIDA